MSEFFGLKKRPEPDWTQQPGVKALADALAAKEQENAQARIDLGAEMQSRNVWQSRAEAAEARAEALAAALELEIGGLDWPNGAHHYTKGIHNGDCEACAILRRLRAALDAYRAVRVPAQPEATEAG